MVFFFTCTGTCTLYLPVRLSDVLKEIYFSFKFNPIYWAAIKRDHVLFRNK